MKTELETTREEKERAAFVRGLREFADFIEATLEAPLPYGAMFNVFADDKAHFAELARAIGGRLDKVHTPTYVAVARRFGPISYEVNIARGQVCERRVVETRIVEARVIPETVIPEHVEEVFAWDCWEPILKNGGGE